MTIETMCRVCLRQDKNLIDLEHIENEPNETLISKLIECVSEVEWSICKPLLCHPCIKRLNNAYQFRRDCLSSTLMIKGYLALVENEKEPEKPKRTLPSILANKNVNKRILQFSSSKSNNKTVNEILTEAKTEELSVEIDPNMFTLSGPNTPDDESNDEVQDYDNIISSSQISLKEVSKVYAHFVPILPKPGGALGYAKSGEHFVPILPKPANETNFHNSGEHFLSSRLYGSMDIQCEKCLIRFASIKLLKLHIKESHPERHLTYRCEFCYENYAQKSAYDDCMRSHQLASDPLAQEEDEKPAEAEDTTDLECDVCNQSFSSHNNLLRHKLKKHQTNNGRKRYYIKGMKNAKCDICNREFSTQSYLQLHRKLHLRDGVGWHRKIQGRPPGNKQEREVKRERVDSGSSDNE